MPTKISRIGIDYHVVDEKFQGYRFHVQELFARVIEQSPDMAFILFRDRPEKLDDLFPIFSVLLRCASNNCGQ